MTRLSKSRVVSGTQCAKKLYLQVNQPQLATLDPDAEFRMEQGHVLGEVARTLFPGGTLIEHDHQLDAAIAETTALLESGEDIILYEATFQGDDVLNRADILVRENRQLVVYEVKSAGKEKDYYLADCAVQYWVMAQAGHQPDKFYLSHVNPDFVYPGDGNYDGLLIHVDMTDRVIALQEEVNTWVNQCKQTLEGDTPDVECGKHCKKPFKCGFHSHCAPVLSEYPVTLLPRGGKVAQELIEEGITDLRDVPSGRLKSAKHERIRSITVSGEAELDPAAEKIMRGLAYPHYHLDFETVQFVVPIWEGTQPWKQLPFQWSCHIQQKNGDVTHREHLDVSGRSPMRQLTEEMIDCLGEEGTVFSYHHFEKQVIKLLINLYSDLEDDLNKILDRLVDLLPITETHYYHPDQKGSWSIKKVLPTIAPDLSYEDVGEVQHGTAAARSYLVMIHQDTSDKRKSEIAEALLAYCKLDTLAMIKVSDHLTGRRE